MAPPRVVLLRAANSLLPHEPCCRAAIELLQGAAKCPAGAKLDEYFAQVCELIGRKPAGRPREDAEDLAGAALYKLHTSGGGTMSHAQIAAQTGKARSTVRNQIRTYRNRRGL
jgi:hypothetical protein